MNKGQRVRVRLCFWVGIESVRMIYIDLMTWPTDTIYILQGIIDNK